MKITDIKFKIATFKFVEPFKIAFAVIEGYDTLVVKIETDEGICGYGYSVLSVGTKAGI